LWKAVFGELFHQSICEQFALSKPFVGNYDMLYHCVSCCETCWHPMVRMAQDIKKSIYIEFSTLCVVTHVKISAQRSQLWYTAQYILGYTPHLAQRKHKEQYQLSYTDILPISKDTRSYE
jgi:hypothetical protein